MAYTNDLSVDLTPATTLVDRVAQLEKRAINTESLLRGELAEARDRILTLERIVGVPPREGAGYTSQLQQSQYGDIRG